MLLKDNIQRLLKMMVYFLLRHHTYSVKLLISVLGHRWLGKKWITTWKCSLNVFKFCAFLIQLDKLLYKKRTKRVQLSHNIVQLVIVQNRVCAHLVTLVVFFQVTWKRLKKVEWDNKSLIRRFGVKYRCLYLSLFVFWLALWARQNTAQLIKIYGDTSHRNI